MTNQCARAAWQDATPSVREQSRDQSRYNEYGKKRLQALRAAGDRAAAAANEGQPRVNADVLAAVGPLGGAKLLELGCGIGEFAVFCAGQGANVTGVDLGADLVAAAREWAYINGVPARFQRANVVDLPFGSGTYDIVVGLAVLHHLSRTDLVRAVAETHRVLREGGRAFFFEPVQQSAIVEHIRNALPREIESKYGTYHRPSIWQREQWTRYLASLDDRYLTVAELAYATRRFAQVEMHPQGLFAPPGWRIDRRYGRTLARVERALVKRVPRLARLCRCVLVECRKAGGARLEA